MVASGYHRNLDGIRDAYRVLVARIPEDVPTLAAILRDRGVRWIVTCDDPTLFVRGSRTFPEFGEFGRTQRIEYYGGGRYGASYAHTQRRSAPFSGTRTSEGSSPVPSGPRTR